MARYIGLDAHATTCTLAVVGPSGRRLGTQVVETNGAALIEAVKTVARPRHLCLEEGTQSAWLYEVLRPVVDELVVTQQTRSTQGNKNDKLDAYGLATGLLKDTLPRRIYKSPHSFAKLRTLAHGYTKLSRDVARCKNRLKSLYLSRGIHAVGKSVYGSSREQWLEQLPASCRTAALLLYAQLDAMVALNLIPRSRSRTSYMSAVVLVSVGSENHSDRGECFRKQDLALNFERKDVFNPNAESLNKSFRTFTFKNKGRSRRQR